MRSNQGGEARKRTLVRARLGCGLLFPIACVELYFFAYWGWKSTARTGDNAGAFAIALGGALLLNLLLAVLLLRQARRRDR